MVLNLILFCNLLHDHLKNLKNNFWLLVWLVGWLVGWLRGGGDFVGSAVPCGPIFLQLLVLPDTLV